MPCKDELAATSWQARTTKYVQTVVEELAASIEVCSQSQQHGYNLRVAFLWKVVSKLCSFLPPSSLNLTNPPELKLLACIFELFWPTDNIDHSLVTLPMEEERALTDEMKVYRKWFDAIRNSLRKNYDFFLNDKLAVQQIRDYVQNYTAIETFHRAFCCDNEVVAFSDLLTKRDALNEMEKNLEALLYFAVPSHSEW